MTRQQAGLVVLAGLCLVAAFHAGAGGHDQWLVLFAGAAGGCVAVAVALRDGPP